MFTESMTSIELLEEYHKDLAEIQKRTKALCDSDYVDRILYKNRMKKEVSIMKEIVTERRNKYLGLIYYQQESTKTKKKWEYSSFHVGIMESDRGVVSIVFHEQMNAAILFTPHFFSRYKERMQSQGDWKFNRLSSGASLYDIISLYIKRNGYTVMKNDSVKKDKIHIFCPINDGVALMQYDTKRGTHQANTFVTYDMLSKSQYQKTTEMLDYLTKYY